MKRRFLCFALAAVMASGMIGTGAFAEEQDKPRGAYAYAP